MLPLLLMGLQLAHADPPLTGTVTGSLTDVGTAGAPFVVKHGVGTVGVTCQAGSSVGASLAYTLGGADTATLQALAAQIQIQVTHQGLGAKVEVIVPPEVGALPQKQLDLTVTLPTKALLDVQAGTGPLNIAACQGTLKTRNTGGPVTLNGVWTKVDVVSPTGPITATLGAATLSAQSLLKADVGNITVQMPDLSAQLDAVAQHITVQMPDLVPTTQTETTLTATLEQGGALLQIRALGGTLLIQ